MIVVGPNYSAGHLPSPEAEKAEKEREEHARLFVLWALKKARSPWNKDRIMDAYEEYVESLGATRSERRRIMARIDFPLRHAFLYMNRGLIKEHNFSHRYALTPEGRAAAKGMKAPPLPESIQREIRSV